MLLKRLAKQLIGKLPPKFRCLLQSLRYGGDVRIGYGSYIHPAVHLLGKANIRVGTNTCVSEGCWLNVNHRQANKVSIEIGNNCFIGKQNFFTAGDIISIGDYTLTTIDCKFIGSTHKIEDPEVPYLLTGTTGDDQIEIGVNCFLGAGSTILGNVKVGHGSVVGADSLVLQDIPPFSLAVGKPAKVVRRYSFIQKAWLPISKISAADEAAMPNREEYLAKLNAKFSHVNIPWIAAGRSMGNL